MQRRYRVSGKQSGDRSEGIYGQILKQHYAHYTVRLNSELIGYVSVLSNGIADAFLLDLMVLTLIIREQGVAVSLCKEQSTI